MMSDRPPCYPSKASLARELDISTSTVEVLVKRGILPPPVPLSNGLIRWDWAEVKQRLDARKPGGPGQDVDPYLTGAKNVAAAR